MVLHFFLSLFLLIFTYFFYKWSCIPLFSFSYSVFVFCLFFPLFVGLSFFQLVVFSLFLFFRFCCFFFFLFCFFGGVVFFLFPCLFFTTWSCIFLLLSPFMLLPRVSSFSFDTLTSFISPTNSRFVCIIFLSRLTVYIFLIFPIRPPLSISFVKCFSLPLGLFVIFSFFLSSFFPFCSCVSYHFLFLLSFYFVFIFLYFFLSSVGFSPFFFFLLFSTSYFYDPMSFKLTTQMCTGSSDLQYP